MGFRHASILDQSDGAYRVHDLVMRRHRAQPKTAGLAGDGVGPGVDHVVQNPAQDKRREILFPPNFGVGGNVPKKAVE
jgi:hypothetical protein